MRSIIVDSRDISNKTWIIGGVGGGIYKTTDSGVNYEHLTPELDNAYITALVQGEQNPNIIYAGAGAAWTYASAGFSGGSILYKSNDGGNNWNNISLKDSLGNVDQKFRSISRMVIDPKDDDILTIATWAGSSFANDNAAGFIYRTEDGGNTWEQIYQGGPQQRITQLFQLQKIQKFFMHQYLKLVCLNPLMVVKVGIILVTLVLLDLLVMIILMAYITYQGHLILKE